jgi:choline dehydrogenase
MVSGIGPAAGLKAIEVPVVQDLPGVGSHLVDHPVVDLYFKDKLNASTKYIKPHFIFRKGPIATNVSPSFIFLSEKLKKIQVGESAAFVHSEDPLLVSDEIEPSKSHDLERSPDLEIFSSPFAYKEHARYIHPVHTFSIHGVLLRYCESFSKHAYTFLTLH